MSYFVLYLSEDGEVHLSRMSKGEILRDMTPDDDGYAEMLAEDILSDADLKNFNDLHGGKRGYIIIKGEIVTPTIKKVVTTFELE